MPTFRLHGFSQSGNTYKVALYLACAGLDWEPVFVDYLKGATRDPGWRQSTNAMGEAPVLEVDGKRLTQSAAILTWLAEETGRFQPRTEDERYEALRWMLFDNHKFTSYFATYRFLKFFAAQEPHPEVMSFLKARVDGALAIVDKHLSTSPYVAGSAPTIADFSMVGYMYYPAAEHGYDFAFSHPALYAWTERLKGLSGWKAPYDLLPGEQLLAPAR